MRRMFAATAALALALAPAAAPAIAAGEAAKPTSEPKLICKRWVEAGSLVRKRKQCHTAAEWEQVAEAERRGAQRTMDQLTERSSCTDPNNC